MEKTREEEIADEIKEEFCKRVIPSDIVVYLHCLTDLDEEKIEAVENQNGHQIAARTLLQRLQRRADWLPDLIRALLNPDLGLEDLGKKVEEKSRQLRVTITVKEKCSDGIHCGEEMDQTRVDSRCQEFRNNSVKTDEIQDEGSDCNLERNNRPTDCSLGENNNPVTGFQSNTQINNPATVVPSNTQINNPERQELVYKIFNTLYKDVQTSADIPGVMSFAKQMIAEIDEIATGSIKISFRMESEEKLEGFWQLYRTGGLVSLMSRDILSANRKAKMEEEATLNGIELCEVSLDVFIKESDYRFVKHAVRNKNIPLLARNYVETILLYGKDNTLELQHERNQHMASYRRYLPTKLEKVFNDPFVQEKFSNVEFLECLDLKPLKIVRHIYISIIEKLHSEFKDLVESDLKDIFHLAYFLTKCPNYECQYSTAEDTIVLAHGDINKSFNRDYVKSFSRYIDLRMSKLKFVSELVLTYLAARYATENKQNMETVCSTELFPLIAGALQECKVYEEIEEKLSLSNQHTIEFHYFKLLYEDSIDSEPFRDVEAIHIELSKDAIQFLHLTVKERNDLEVLFYTPFPLSHTERQLSRMREGSTDSGILPSSKFPSIILNKQPQMDTFHIVKIWSEDKATGFEFYSIHIPDYSEDFMTYVTCIAQTVNLLGSGNIRVTIETSPHIANLHTVHENIEKFFTIQYRIIPQNSELIGPLKLDLSSCPMTNKSTYDLELAFLNGLEMYSLNLDETGIHCTHVRKLCWAAAASNITELTLSNNNLLFQQTDKDHGVGFGHLASLEILKMRNCGIGDEGMTTIGRDILELKKLKTIDFSKNGFSSNGLKTLCHVLRHHLGLNSVEIQENEVGPDGGLVLSTLIEDLEFLEMIDISYSRLGDKGSLHIVKALRNEKVKKVNFRCNDITTVGSEDIFQLLTGCHRLYHFELGENQIGRLEHQPSPKTPTSCSVGKLFWKMVNSCRNAIEYLGFEGCSLGYTSAFYDSKKLSDLQEITEIVLKDNQLTDIHALCIGKSLQSLNCLQYLNLSSNNIGPEGATVLADGIERCPSLMKIALDRNQINNFDVLKQILKVSTRSRNCLKKLDLSHNVNLKDEANYKMLVQTARNCLHNPYVKKEPMGARIETKSTLILL